MCERGFISLGYTSQSEVAGHMGSTRLTYTKLPEHFQVSAPLCIPTGKVHAAQLPHTPPVSGIVSDFYFGCLHRRAVARHRGSSVRVPNG